MTDHSEEIQKLNKNELEVRQEWHSCFVWLAVLGIYVIADMWLGLSVHLMDAVRRLMSTLGQRDVEIQSVLGVVLGYIVPYLVVIPLVAHQSERFFQHRRNHHDRGVGDSAPQT